MNKIKEEPTDLKQITQSFSICRYCQAKITAENELLSRIDYKETEILNLKQQVQNMKLQLDEKDAKL
jgi:hypothetical protein